MEEYFDGLRKIRKKRETIRIIFWPFFYLVLLFGLLGAVFRPLAIIEVIIILFGYFMYLRFALSLCPRCNKHYFNLFNIFTYYSYFMDIFATQCSGCGLKMSVLPEVEEYKVQSNDKEWRE